MSATIGPLHLEPPISPERMETLMAGLAEITAEEGRMLLAMVVRGDKVIIDRLRSVIESSRRY